MRKFEKISYEQFKKDINLDESLYNDYVLPSRSTKYSAGYDIKALEDFILRSGESMKIPTGLKVMMEPDEVFMVYIRSSMGTKYNIKLMNGVGIIDCDYYNNPSNEGHFYISLRNEGPKDFIAKAGDGIAQGIFMKYLTVDDEQKIESTRIGGFGSTNKEEK